MNTLAKCAVILLSLSATGCVSKPPTIAHVHLGHAVTSVHVTPDHEGYLPLALRRAQDTYDHALQAHRSSALEEMKTHAVAIASATSSEDGFGLKQSLTLASNHISFAATSEDASANVQQAAPTFARDIARVIERCELIGLLTQDVARSGSTAEAMVSIDEIVKLARANLDGEDLDGDGTIGATAEFGVKQLRTEFDGIIARENPAYRTVDQWYLFNLVRLPNGRWVFDKLSRGGNIEGYK